MIFDNSINIKMLDGESFFLTSFFDRNLSFDHIQSALRPHKRQTCVICNGHFFPIPDEDGYWDDRSETCQDLAHESCAIIQEIEDENNQATVQELNQEHELSRKVLL